MSSNRRLKNGYPKTFWFIFFSLMIYGGLVTLCVFWAWPRYMVGGEPLSTLYIQNQAVIQLVRDQQQFQIWYALLSLLAGVVAFGVYLFFIRLWKYRLEAFSSGGVHLKYSMILVYASILIYFWTRLFRLSGALSTYAYPLSNFLLLLFGGFYLLNLVSTVIKAHKRNDSQDRSYKLLVLMVLDVIGVFFNIGPLFLTYGWLDWWQQTGQNFIVFLSNIANPSIPGYNLVTVTQYILALTPFLALLYLFLFLTYCMPSHMGSDLYTDGHFRHFYCMDK